MLWLLWLSGLFGVTAQALTVTDAAGAKLVLDKPAQRIVALTPHATELLFSVGAEKQIVGVVEHSDYPKAAQQLPRVGGYGSFNLEAIMALEPDLIIYWPGGNPAREIQRLQKLGFPLFGSNPKNFDDIASELEKMALLTGHSEATQALITDFRLQVESLYQQNKRKPRVRVFYQVWDSPMLSQNDLSFITRVIELCGGRNIFGHLPMLSPQVSIEAVLAANPDVILAGSHQGKAPTWLKDWQQYPYLKAVKHQQLKTINSDVIHRPTMRLLDAAKQMCRLLDDARGDL